MLTNLIYYSWVRHGIEPSKIYSMGSKERLLLYDFMEIEAEMGKEE